MALRDWMRAATVATPATDGHSARPSAATVAIVAVATRSPAGMRTTARGDDRRTCQQCANLSLQGRCLAAWRGERPWGAHSDYSPAPDLLQHCASYLPGPADMDRRRGCDRWPNLRASAVHVRQPTNKGSL